MLELDIDAVLRFLEQQTPATLRAQIVQIDERIAGLQRTRATITRMLGEPAHAPAAPKAERPAKAAPEAKAPKAAKAPRAAKPAKPAGSAKPGRASAISDEDAAQQVLAALRAAGDKGDSGNSIAKQIGLLSPRVNGVLKTLRERGMARNEGNRRSSRWYFDAGPTVAHPTTGQRLVRKTSRKK
jgi:chorismate mutase